MIITQLNSITTVKKMINSTQTLLPRNSNQTIGVSVIIPTHNRIAMLEEAISSVFSQDFDGTFEIIVVDDNSQDKTSEVVSKNYPEVKLISLQQNIGAYAARNRALAKTKGKYIAFLDSDDLWDKNYLKSQISHLKNKEKCFCVSGLVVWNTADNQKQIYSQKPNLEKYTSLMHHLLVASFIYTPSSVVIPRQVFEEVGLFDETIRIGEDAALYERCIIAGYQPIFTSKPLAIKRKHSSDQLTNAKNLEKRKKQRLIRVNKLYPLIEKQFPIVSLQRIYAEIHADFASQYISQKYFIHWLNSSIASAMNDSVSYTFLNMLEDIKNLIHKQLMENS